MRCSFLLLFALLATSVAWAQKSYPPKDPHIDLGEKTAQPAPPQSAQDDMARLLERNDSGDNRRKVIVLGEEEPEPLLPTVDRNDYRLAPGDLIRVLVFQNPDLTLDTRISESGDITYPLVGIVRIGGLSLNDAEMRIANALAAGDFVRSPQVNIVLGQIRGNQVSVLGQVNRPGRYPLETFNLRVSDFLAMAGGITQVGSDTVIINGERNGERFRKEIDLPTAYVEGLESEDMVVQAGDVIYVNRAPVFYIYGEVQRPGSYRIERGMTVQQALAQSGGITPRGTEHWLRLDRRNADGVVQRFTPEWTDPVLPNDVIYVRESIF
ncbi:MAG: polysaccharide export protein EpsE [Zoogloeaceae bacterium]|nr:polysaccharide export protein EpsE [Zoogloeaceae bacterium]